MTEDHRLLERSGRQGRFLSHPGVDLQLLIIHSLVAIPINRNVIPRISWTASFLDWNNRNRIANIASMKNTDPLCSQLFLNVHIRVLIIDIGDVLAGITRVRHSIHVHVGESAAKLPYDVSCNILITHAPARVGKRAIRIGIASRKLRIVATPAMETDRPLRIRIVPRINIWARITHISYAITITVLLLDVLTSSTIADTRTAPLRTIIAGFTDPISIVIFLRPVDTTTHRQVVFFTEARRTVVHVIRDSISVAVLQIAGYLNPSLPELSDGGVHLLIRVKGQIGFPPPVAGTHADEHELACIRILTKKRTAGITTLALGVVPIEVQP